MKKNKFRMMIVFIIVIVSLITIAAPVLADVGNTYSSNSSRNNSDEYGSDYMDIIFWIFYLLPFPINIIVAIGAVVAFVVVRGKVRQQYAVPPPSIPAIDLSILKNNDTGFSEREFIAFVRDVFIKVQKAWCERNWELVRPFESNELFETHNVQLSDYIAKGHYPHLERQEIRDVTISKYDYDDKFEYLSVRLYASLLDYTTDDTGKLIDGSSTIYQYRDYRLIFKRVRGVQSKALESGTTNCPKCGAPTAITSSGKCGYCGSVITTGEYGWVLDAYSAWNKDY